MRVVFVLIALISIVDARLLRKKKSASVTVEDDVSMDIDEPPRCKDYSKRACLYEKRIALMELHLMTLIMGEEKVINDYTGNNYDQAPSWEAHTQNPMKGAGVRFVQFGAGGTDSTMMGHFYFKRKDMRTSSDSYDEGWQKDGTHGFCQTYAACGFTGLGVPNFVNADAETGREQKMAAYVHNSRIAISVVKDNFVERYFTPEMWKHAIDRMYTESKKKVVFPYEDLTVPEIQHDLDCIMRQSDVFLKYFINNEYTFAVDSGDDGNPACPDLEEYGE